MLSLQLLKHSLMKLCFLSVLRCNDQVLLQLEINLLMTLTFLQKMMVIITVMYMMIDFHFLLLKIGVHLHDLLHLLVMHLLHWKILILIVKTGLNRLKENISVDRTLLRVLYDEGMLTCLVLRDLLGLVSCLDLHP